MKIFTNESLQENKFDFTRWETTNGDYVKITDVGNGYLERSMDVLGQYIERYPSHVNQQIWQRYMTAFENEVTDRKGYMDNQRKRDKDRNTLYHTMGAVG